jgi:hypothetical protein
MAPLAELTPDGTQTALVQHRGRILQVFLAPWNRPGRSRPELHLHVQDTAGGAGQIVPDDSDFAKELRLFHPEVADLQPSQAALDLIAGSPSESGAPASAPAAFDYQKLAAEILRQQAVTPPPAPPAVVEAPVTVVPAPDVS